MAEVEMLPGTSSRWARTQWLRPSPAQRSSPASLPPVSPHPICPLWSPQSLPCFQHSGAPAALRIMSRVLTLAFEALASPLYPAHQVLAPLEMPSHTHSPFSNLHSNPASSRNHPLPSPSPYNLPHLARGPLPPPRPGILYCPAAGQCPRHRLSSSDEKFSHFQVFSRKCAEPLGSCGHLGKALEGDREAAHVPRRPGFTGGSVWSRLARVFPGRPLLCFSQSCGFLGLPWVDFQ